MILLVGLGNPGARYQGHRHNIGYMAIDAIRTRHRFGPERKRFQGLFSEGEVETAAGPMKVCTLKPTTYMNESGRAVAEAVHFYKLDLKDVVVVYDEIDLAPGKVRVRLGGGVAGHNGLRSIRGHLGPDFRRVRIGIGHPGDKRVVQHFVLQNFTKGEREWVAPLLDAVAKATPLLAEGNDSEFMNRVHLATRPIFDRDEPADLPPSEE